MEFTGERYISNLDWAEMSYEHWHRYLFATQFVSHKIVLDVACGEGYGSNLLAEEAAQVMGVDKDSETIQFASAKYFRPNLEFKVGLAEKLPFEMDQAVDVVTSFETIEHLTESKQVDFLTEVKRVLKPDGLLMMSTPNKLLYSDEPEYKNEFHRREFYIEEFSQFLQRFFKEVHLLGQQVYPGSYIWPIHTEGQQRTDFQLEFVNGQYHPNSCRTPEAYYLLAICSDKTITVPGISSLLDMDRRAILNLNAQLVEQGRIIESLNAQLVEQERIIENLTHGSDRQEQLITQLRALLKASEWDLSALQTKIRELEQRYQAAIQQHKAESQHYEATSQQHKAEFESLQAQNHEQQGILNSIYGSRAWRALLFYWRLIEWLLPAGSNRRNLVEKILMRGSPQKESNSDDDPTYA